MEMKSIMHIYVEHTCNAKEVEVGDVQEDDVGDVQEDEVGDVHTNDVGDVNTYDVGDVQEDENDDSGSSEDNGFEVDDLSFDDSEDEIALGLDDFFEEHGRSDGVKVIANKHKLTPKSVPTVVDNASSSSGVDNEMDINYASEELESSDLDASDEEKDTKYPKFKMEDLDKNYKFGVGLEFVSLDEFKEAITEWSLLNGREIRYIKNDKVRINYGITLYTLDYILFAPVPTIDEVPATPVSTTPRVLKPKKKPIKPKVSRKLELKRSVRTMVLK
ncbi:hypothetical protein KIW84_041067 [Lathyrus oleraceus]|uniref:Uncharacterized protein n=1 Tax=Pisum sativum TaxID=3888 RepID=A0A9D4X901_PEA|nr:hypothetical protein KIW84_041067 [Pisum sativum]